MRKFFHAPACLTSDGIHAPIPALRRRAQHYDLPTEHWRGFGSLEGSAEVNPCSRPRHLRWERLLAAQIRERGRRGDRAGPSHIRIDALAAHYARTPPRTIRPRHNVIMRLCSGLSCFSHPLETCPTAANKLFCDDVIAWSKVVALIYVWDYTTDFEHYEQPFPNFDSLQSNVRFLVKQGVKGIATDRAAPAFPQPRSQPFAGSQRASPARVSLFLVHLQTLRPFASMAISVQSPLATPLLAAFCFQPFLLCRIIGRRSVTGGTRAWLPIRHQASFAGRFDAPVALRMERPRFTLTTRQATIHPPQDSDQAPRREPTRPMALLEGDS